MSDRQQLELPTLVSERSPSSSTPRLSCATPRSNLDPADAQQVAEALRSYLAAKLGVPGLDFRKQPHLYPDGWESCTYGFQLHGPALPHEWTRPLIAHICSTAEAAPQLQRAFVAQRFLWEHGFPVPRPLLLEDRNTPFSGPFLVQQRAPGRTLLRLLLCAPWRMWGMPGAMGRLHARLHRLPTEGFPAPGGEFLGRRLEEIDTFIRADGLPGLTAGLDWLHAQQPKSPERPSILHLDFHPVNLIHRQVRKLAVLDWTEADLGDYHADVASTLMLIDCMPVPRPTRSGRILAPLGRCLLKRWYLSAYRRRNPLDEEKLAYYGAWAALHRLCIYGHWQQAGSHSAPCNPTALAILTPDLLRGLEKHFKGLTGVDVRA